MEEIAEMCAVANPRTLKSLHALQPVCAVFSEDEAWYRAQVTNVTDIQSAEVSFVDYGNSEIVSISNMQPMQEVLMKEPVFAIACSLENSNGKWKENAVSEFIEKTANVVLKMKVKQRSGNMCVVDLCFDNGTNVADDLAAKSSSEQSISAVSYPAQKLDGCIDTELYVTHVNSPGDLYVQLVTDTDNLDDMMMKMEDSPKPAGTLRSVEPGMACLTVFSVDMALYRSVVEICNGSKATVKFVDYGNAEEKSIDELYPLPKEFAVLPPFAIHCQLKGAKTEASASDVVKFTDSVCDRKLQGKLQSCL